MTVQPPPGSKISIATDDADTVIVVPYDSGGFARYGAAAFLVFWLGAWAYGWHDVAGKIIAGNVNAFLVFWLGGWTVGGAAACFALYRMLRPVIPETFRLMREGVRYDSGNPSVQMSFGPMNPRPSWSSMFPRRARADIDREQLRSLHLRQTALGNRLTVDAGVSRLDLARDATEIEREWLYQTLAKHYSLPVPKEQ